MAQTIEINEGEIVVKLTNPVAGKISFKDLGITEGQLGFEGGFVRIVFDLSSLTDHVYYAVPTIEISYVETVGETHWQCDFNDQMILNKLDHYGNSTVILMDRNKMSSLEQHHENRLILHAEFPSAIHLVAETSYINFFK